MCIKDTFRLQGVCIEDTLRVAESVGRCKYVGSVYEGYLWVNGQVAVGSIFLQVFW